MTITSRRTQRLRLGWALSEIASGTLTVKRGTSTVMSAPIRTGTAGSVWWNGGDGTGTPLPDGTYTVTASLVDRVANRSTLSSTVILDRTAGFLRASRQFFNPADGDTLAASTTLSFRLTQSAQTTLRIFSGATLVRGAWYGRSQAAGTVAWAWDGRDDAGGYVRPGIYRALLVVVRNGIRHDIPYSLRVGPFGLSLTPTSPTAGQALTVLATSSEPLAAAPRVTLAQVGLAPVTRSAVLQPDGRWKAVFIVAAGGVGRATVAVEGKDTLGGTNRATATIVVR